MQGAAPGEALQKAYAQQSQNRLRQVQAATLENEMQRRQMMQNIPQEAFASLDPQKILQAVGPVNPELAYKMATMAVQNRNAMNRQRMLQNMMGGMGVPSASKGAAMQDPNRIAQMAMATGDTQMMQYAQFLQGQQKRESDIEKKERELKVSGLEIQEGVTPVSKDVEKVKAAKLSHGKLQDLVDDLKTLTDKTSGVPILGMKLAKDIDNTMAQIQLEAKNLYELGALQAPDIELINRMLVDPSSLSAKVMTTGEIKDSLDTFKNRLSDAYGAALSVRGYRDPKLLPTDSKPESPTEGLTLEQAEGLSLEELDALLEQMDNGN